MDDEVSKGRPASTRIEASAKTLSGFRTLDIRTDRLLSSWLREAGVPEGALKARSFLRAFRQVHGYVPAESEGEGRSAHGQRGGSGAAEDEGRDT
jgi:hypothetical protein